MKLVVKKWKKEVLGHDLCHYYIKNKYNNFSYVTEKDVSSHTCEDKSWAWGFAAITSRLLQKPTDVDNPQKKSDRKSCINVNLKITFYYSDYHLSQYDFYEKEIFV